ncbi:MAG: hypothetical protein FJZ00_10565 [Candidatus Sericytochromatia bacterium]|uniref:Uncharacterized protein n=1 Tax=Candidatus Tanganyikabacteria bacterium TaxID=2961651 RepID=A0A937X4B1_9BACT|nr:hypothetical protein [Candidatus Tanganyikabacteria bacterium]
MPTGFALPARLSGTGGNSAGAPSEIASPTLEADRLRDAGRALVADTLTTLQTDADMTAADQLSDDPTLSPAPFRIMAAATTGSTATGSVRPPHPVLRHRPLLGPIVRHAIKRHLDRQREMARKLVAARRTATRVHERTETLNEDGTRTIHARLEMTTKAGGTLKQTSDRVVDAENTVLSAVADLERAFKNGHTLVSHRERKTAEDGSWTVTFTLTATRKDGAVKTVNWTRKGSADGTETGEGTILRFDGSKVTITYARNANGSTLTRTIDSAANIRAEVTKSEGETSADTTVMTPDGQLLEIAAVPDTEDVAPSEK